MPEILDWDGQIGQRLRLRDLHVFAKVVQAGSMAKAAVQLRVTQPAISQVIADLEHASASVCSIEARRASSPTIYGDALMKGGAAAFDDLRQSLKEIEFLANPTSGEVRIGCPETVAALMIADRRTSFRPVSGNCSPCHRRRGSDARSSAASRPYARSSDGPCGGPDFRASIRR